MLKNHQRPLRCRSQFFNEPSLTVAATGSGKTTKSKFWVLQLASLVAGMWLFDFRKREFAALKPYLARVNVELVIVPARRLRMNPLQVPQHCDPRDYAPNLADTLVRILKLPPRAAKLLHLTILYLYRKCCVLDGGVSYPTLFELREAVWANKNAHPESRQAIVASLDPILMSLRDVLCYRHGWPSGELAKRHLVFELGGVSETDKDLLLNTLLIAEFMSRIARGLSNPKMDLWICCDEAAELAHPILSNTPNKFIGRCSSAADYDTIGSAMGLTVEQRRWLATHLTPGLFVGSLGQGWRQPFLFRVPRLQFRSEPDRLGNVDLPLGKGVTIARRNVSTNHDENRLGEGLEPLSSLRTVDAPEFANWQPDWVKEEPAAAVGDSEETNPRFGPSELRYLQAVVDNPGKPSSHYPKLAGLSPRKALEIRKRLVEQKYLREEQVNISSRGRASIILTLTRRAVQLRDAQRDERP